MLRQIDDVYGEVWLIPISLSMWAFLIAKITNYIVIYLIIRTTSYWNKYLVFGNFSTYKIVHLIIKTGISLR